jgi:hypothetical protein
LEQHFDEEGGGNGYQHQATEKDGHAGVSPA